jgi:hypothetical protein
MLWFRKSSGYAPSSSSMWLARVDTIEFACGSVPLSLLRRSLYRCGHRVVCAGAVREGLAKRQRAARTAYRPYGRVPVSYRVHVL